MTRARRTFPILLLAGVVSLGFAVAYFRLWPFVIDDTFISLRYAKNLAAGHGLVYNLGERVEGYTNFLWTVALAIPQLLRVDPVPVLKLANLILALATAWLIYRLGRESVFASGAMAIPPARGPEGGAQRAPGSRTGREGNRPSHESRAARRQPVAAPASRPSDATELAVSSALLFLVTPAVVLSAAEGLETMLFTFFLALAALWFFEEREAASFPRSALALVALALTRPDGAVFGLFFLAIAVAWRRQRGYLARFAALFLGIGAIYFIARWAYYGQLLPNTFYAKGTGTRALLAQGWFQLRAFGTEFGALAWFAMIPALIARRTRRAALVLFGIFALRIAFQLWSGGAWMGRYRFLVPVIPFVILLVVAGLAAIRPPLARRAALAVAATVLIGPGWLLYSRSESIALDYAASLARAHIQLGRAIHAGTSPGAVMAMDDAGAGPYFAERTNIDMLGLNDTHIAHLPGRYNEKFDVAYVLGRKPDLVVLASRVPEPAEDRDLRLPGHAALFRDPRFQAEYRFVRPYMFNPTYYLSVYRWLDSTAVPADF
jgi:arabinofuranosyltransferase